MPTNFRYRWLCSLALSGLLALPAAAGSVNLSWQPSTGATGYKVYWGPSPGQYPNSQDVGNSTQTTVNGLTDCTQWYFAATAYNAAGESTPTEPVTSWPRAVITTIVPSGASQGTQVNVTLSGTNFQPGSSLAVANPGVTVGSVTVGSCSQMSASFTVASSAATGATNVSVTNTAGVTGTATGAFTVQQATSQPLPDVQNLRREDRRSGV